MIGEREELFKGTVRRRLTGCWGGAEIDDESACVFGGD